MARSNVREQLFMQASFQMFELILRNVSAAQCFSCIEFIPSAKCCKAMKRSPGGTLFAQMAGSLRWQDVMID